MTKRWPRIVVTMFSCLLAVATSAPAQPDECARVRNARRQAENDLMLLLASPLFSDAEWYAAAVQMGINPHYDPYPAANARRQARAQQMQMLIAQISKREREVCSEPAPRSEREQPTQPAPRDTLPTPATKDRTACPFGQYWNSEREQCVKIGE